MQKFCVFEYLYRDAANYKAWGTLVLRGVTTESDLEALATHFESGGFLLPNNWAFRHFMLSCGSSVTDRVLMTTYGIRFMRYGLQLKKRLKGLFLIQLKTSFRKLEPLKIGIQNYHRIGIFEALNSTTYSILVLVNLKCSRLFWLACSSHPRRIQSRKVLLTR